MNFKRITLSIFICIVIMLSSLLVLTISNTLVDDSKVVTNDLLAYVDDITTIETTTEETTTTTTEEITTVEITTSYIVPGIVERKGNVSDYYLNLANNEMNKLPSNIINTFVSTGWHIYVTDENIAQTVYGGMYSSVQGSTDYSGKTILIEDRYNAITESIIHEMGHFVDYITGFSTNTSYFSRIYDEEAEEFRSRIVNSSCVRDEQELFAEEFYYIYKNPSKCTEQTYNYILQRINTL